MDPSGLTRNPQTVFGRNGQLAPSETGLVVHRPPHGSASSELGVGAGPPVVVQHGDVLNLAATGVDTGLPVSVHVRAAHAGGRRQWALYELVSQCAQSILQYFPHGMARAQLAAVSRDFRRAVLSDHGYARDAQALRSAVSSMPDPLRLQAEGDFEVGRIDKERRRLGSLQNYPGEVEAYVAQGMCGNEAMRKVARLTHYADRLTGGQALGSQEQSELNALLGEYTPCEPNTDDLLNAIERMKSSVHESAYYYILEHMGDGPSRRPAEDRAVEGVAARIKALFAKKVAHDLPVQEPIQQLTQYQRENLVNFEKSVVYPRVEQSFAVELRAVRLRQARREPLEASPEIDTLRELGFGDVLRFAYMARKLMAECDRLLKMSDSKVVSRIDLLPLREPMGSLQLSFWDFANLVTPRRDGAYTIGAMRTHLQSMRDAAAEQLFGSQAPGVPGSSTSTSPSSSSSSSSRSER
jgi:hypothetical protein